MKYKKYLDYPDDFFDFSNGVDIKDDEINQWINDCLNTIDFKKKDDWTSVQSGNTAVFVFKLDDEIEIMVSKNYATFSCNLKDIIKS